MQADHRRKSRERYPPLSTDMIPPGYQWQEEVLGQDGLFQTSALDVVVPPVEIGRTLVFGMAKPPSWDTLDEPAKWLMKRKYLCERYGDLCFNFLEDSDDVRNQHGRIIVAPNDYYALFEVWSSPKVEQQYRSSMVLLEEGLRMDHDSFLELKRSLGVSSANLVRSSIKRPHDENASQVPTEDSSDQIKPRYKVKRVRIQEPTPTPGPQQESHPMAEPFAYLSLPDKHKMSRSLFPAACMASNASKSPAPKSCIRPFTTIPRTEFAKRLQALHPSPQVQVPRFRLCQLYGKGKIDAAQVEGTQRERVICTFNIVVESCTRIGAFGNLEIDQIIQVLAHSFECADHPDLTSDEFVNANTALKWTILYVAYMKTMIKSTKAIIGDVDWSTKWEHDLSARIELFQDIQDQAWLRFCRAAARYQREMKARMNS